MIVTDQGDFTVDRQAQNFDRASARRWCWLVAALCAVLSLWVLPAKADSGDTLAYIQTRGALRCGVSTGITGFSAQDSAGHWAGLDVDFCRAVAAAILGDPAKVQFVPLSARARFPAIESGDIDILARNTTWTVYREATFSVSFIGVTYFDERGFIARAGGPFAQGSLNGARICVELDSNQTTNLNSYASAQGLHVTIVPEVDFTGEQQAFIKGDCAVMTDDISSLAEFLAHVPDPSAYIIRPERIAKEPLGPLVRWDDGQWVAIVRAVYAALLDADERGLTQAQARLITANSKDPAAIAYLAQTSPIGAALGISPLWAVKAIAAGGNYGEIFNRNLGASSPLKLDPGPNKPWTEGGLLYAPPFQ